MLGISTCLSPYVTWTGDRYGQTEPCLCCWRWTGKRCKQAERLHSACSITCQEESDTVCVVRWVFDLRRLFPEAACLRLTNKMQGKGTSLKNKRWGGWKGRWTCRCRIKEKEEREGRRAPDSHRICDSIGNRGQMKVGLMENSRWSLKTVGSTFTLTPIFSN